MTMSNHYIALLCVFVSAVLSGTLLAPAVRHKIGNESCLWCVFLNMTVFPIGWMISAIVISEGLLRNYRGK